MTAKILIIDDDMDFLKETKDLLEWCGCEVSVACLEEEWMDEIQNMPDIILLDRHLKYPSGYTDGLTIYRMIKGHKRFSKIPVVFISGAFSEEDKENCLLLGAEDYIAKPLDTEDFIERIKRIFK